MLNAGVPATEAARRLGAQCGDAAEALCQLHRRPGAGRERADRSGAGGWRCM